MASLPLVTRVHCYHRRCLKPIEILLEKAAIPMGSTSTSTRLYSLLVRLIRRRRRRLCRRQDMFMRHNNSNNSLLWSSRSRLLSSNRRWSPSPVPLPFHNTSPSVPGRPLPPLTTHLTLRWPVSLLPFLLSKSSACLPCVLAGGIVSWSGSNFSTRSLHAFQRAHGLSCRT